MNKFQVIAQRMEKEGFKKLPTDTVKNQGFEEELRKEKTQNANENKTKQ